ncbi:unnamed protein product [Brachionus calyciflorus]|uniref:Cyclin-dependent kinase inhibitor domain-containing protein n=1 Tax=Brachionus calyciflorus TaxID=104777 RepID=A0A813XBS6_9BILA|nr:unnamed protein product [Brachionus calyciflorus]
MRSKSTVSTSIKSKSVKQMFKPIKSSKQSDLKSFKSTASPLISSTPSQLNPITSSPIKNTLIKRNLFGIRLNHEQLNRDLKEMWKEQIERQKEQWNFDFEKLKPVHLNRSSKSLNDLSLNDSKRFDWIRVNTYFTQPLTGYSPSFQSISLPDHLLDTSNGNTDFVISAFDKSEIDYEHKIYKDQSSLEEETETEEEEDEALAVPQFYKYQRRLKLMNETKNEKIEDKENIRKRPKINRVSKPKLRHSRRNSTGSTEGKKLTQSLIITFSENRKDTLRSAHNLTSGINKIHKNEQQNDKLKQPSILDLLNKRKRKSSTSQ